jgi:hypothetical protein
VGGLPTGEGLGGPLTANDVVVAKAVVQATAAPTSVRNRRPRDLMS